MPTSCRYCPTCFPSTGATDGGAPGHPGQTVDELAAPYQADHNALAAPLHSLPISLAVVCPQAHDKLLVNALLVNALLARLVC